LPLLISQHFREIACGGDHRPCQRWNPTILHAKHWASNTEGGDHATGVIPDWGPHAPQPFFDFLIVDSKALHANLLKLGFECGARPQRVRSVLREGQLRNQLVERALRQMGREGLPYRRAVHGAPPANSRRRPQRPCPFDIGDRQHLGAIGHADVSRFVRLLDQSTQKRLGAFAETEIRDGAAAELK
jgi:hypothetical protein